MESETFNSCVTSITAYFIVSGLNSVFIRLLKLVFTLEKVWSVFFSYFTPIRVSSKKPYLSRLCRDGNNIVAKHWVRLWIIIPLFKRIPINWNYNFNFMNSFQSFLFCFHFKGFYNIHQPNRLSYIMRTAFKGNRL